MSTPLLMSSSILAVSLRFAASWNSFSEWSTAAETEEQALKQCWQGAWSSMPQQTSPSSHRPWWLQGRMTAERFFQQESKPYRHWQVFWFRPLPLSPLPWVPLCHINALPVLPASLLIQRLSPFAWTCSSPKTFWSIRPGILQGPVPVWGLGQVTQTLSSIPPLTPHCSTRGPAVPFQATWISQAAQNC